MNNMIARKVDLTADYQPLADRRTVVSGTLSATPGNSDTAYLLGDTGQDIPLIPGEWHTLYHVDLSQIQIKGSVGDILTFNGGTW